MVNSLLGQIIQRHVDKGWEDCRYEDMVIGEFPGDACLIDGLGLDVPGERRDEVAWYAAQGLRRTFKEKGDVWKQRLSSDEAKGTLLQVIRHEVQTALKHPAPVRQPIVRLESRLLENGFFEWVPFRCRVAPNERGVYLLAQFEQTLPAIVNPIDASIIDIGMAWKPTSSIKDRLDGFQLVADKGRAPRYRGKNSGWTYRTEFAKSYGQLINFANLYASWNIITDAHTISDVENAYLVLYSQVHGRKPAINKQPLKRIK